MKGIYLGPHGIIGTPSGNKIYHNNFINNTIQVEDYSGANNFLDNGYPDGGNYWSNYSGKDAERDFIGDIPYIFTGGRDNYPLMIPFTTEIDFKNKQIIGLKETTDSISWNLTRFEQNFQVEFANPNFTLNGNSTSEKTETLIDALVQLSRGAKNEIYRLLGYK